MLPTQGQGASQAVEDAEALGSFFETVTDSPSLENISDILEVNEPSFLKVFQSLTIFSKFFGHVIGGSV